MVKMVKIRMDGRSMDVQAGMTILDAAREAGIRIPTLCYSPLLRPLENCRLCVVKIAGEQKFKAACSTPVIEGMDITTADDDIRKTRKFLLELLLDTHYGDCLAPCSGACPAGVDIQGYLALIRHGEYREAVRLVKEKIPMPATIGRVCPHPCEAACRRQLVDDSVAINGCKRFIADYEMKTGERVLAKVAPSTGHRVAVIGGGPAGLSAAYYLRSMGHGVTIFEEREKLGGMLRYGIPAYRLPKDVLDWEIEGIVGLGVEVKSGVKWGRDFCLSGLRADGFEAVFLAIGAWAARGLGIEGEALKGVERGIDFLEKAALTEDRSASAGKRVAVVGGGNVAIDAARTALRLGAQSVTILYRRSRTEMPASHEEIEAAQEEGVSIEFLVAPTQLIGKRGALKALKFVRMELGEPDAGGRRRPVPIEGSEVVLEVDHLISAIGQYPDIPVKEAAGGGDEAALPLTRWNTLGGDPASMHTGSGMIFVGGDVLRGPASVAAALADGRKAAFSLDRSFRSGRIEAEPVEFNISKGGLDSVDREPFSVLRTISRESMPELEARARRGNFEQVELGLSPEQASREASRCLSCGCSAAFDCRLREMMSEFEVDWKEQPGNKIHHQRVAAVDTHPFIALDPNKCIRCERCYVACETFQASGAIVLKEWPRFNDKCLNCGLCVDLCPTGALAERRDGKPIDRLNWRSEKTHCIHCGLGCKLELKLEGDRLAWISGGSSGPPNWVSTCRRGRFRVFDTVWLGERVLKPMIRQNGMLRDASWQEAIETLLSGFKGIHESRGGAALGAMASSRSTTESLYLLQKWMRAGWQSHSIDFPGRDPFEKMQLLIAKSFSSEPAKLDLRGLEKAEALFLLGDKLEELSPVVASLIRRSVKRRNLPVLQISSSPDELTPFASIAFHAEPEDWNEKLLELLGSTTASKSLPSRSDEKKELHFERRPRPQAQSWEALRDAFSLMPSIAFIFPDTLAGSGKTARALETFLRLAGAKAAQGALASIYPLTSQINTFGALLMGVSPRLLPGLIDITDEIASKRFSDAWQAPTLPAERWIAMEEFLDAGLTKALFVQQAELLLEKDARKWKELLGRVEFLAVSESAPSPVMDLAQVVLPMACFGEQSGTVINQEGSVLNLARVFEPRGESLADWEILARIMAAQGLQKVSDLKSVQKEISLLVPRFSGFWEV